MRVKGNPLLDTTTVIAPITEQQVLSTTATTIPAPIQHLSVAQSATTAFVTGTGKTVRPTNRKQHLTTSSAHSDSLPTYSASAFRPQEKSAVASTAREREVILSSQQKIINKDGKIMESCHAYPYTYICRQNVTAYMHMLQLLLHKAMHPTMATVASDCTTFKDDAVQNREHSSFFLATAASLVGTPLYRAYQQQQQHLPFPLLRVHINGVAVKTVLTFFRNVQRLLTISPHKPFVVRSSKQSFGSIGI